MKNNGIVGIVLMVISFLIYGTYLEWAEKGWESAGAWVFMVIVFIGGYVGYFESNGTKKS